MKFIETVTFLGNDVLVPIDRIKFVNISYNSGYRIKITSDDGDWEECFDKDGDKANLRFEQIKEILEAR